jgi:hypothetical protein
MVGKPLDSPLTIPAGDSRSGCGSPAGGTVRDLAQVLAHVHDAEIEIAKAGATAKGSVK